MEDLFDGVESLLEVTGMSAIASTVSAIVAVYRIGKYLENFGQEPVETIEEEPLENEPNVEEEVIPVRKADYQPGDYFEAYG